MPKFILKIISVLFFWGIFVYVVLRIPYPESFAQANFVQMSLFLAPLFLATVFTLNTLLKNIFLSGSISLCLILLLILKALDSLNLITTLLIVVSGGLLISYFRKSKRKNLTKHTKIPKLTHMR